MHVKIKNIRAAMPASKSGAYVMDRNLPPLIKSLSPEMYVIHKDRATIWFGGGFVHWGITIERSANRPQTYTGTRRHVLSVGHGSYVWVR